MSYKSRMGIVKKDAISYTSHIVVYPSVNVYVNELVNTNDNT